VLEPLTASHSLLKSVTLAADDVQESNQTISHRSTSLTLRNFCLLCCLAAAHHGFCSLRRKATHASLLVIHNTLSSGC